MINIAICDKEEQIVDELYKLIYHWFEQLHVSFKIVKSSNGEDLLYEMSELGDFDFIIMGVELGIDNGIEVAAKIKGMNPHCHIVFMSENEQYYKAAFSVQPYQFLDKPIQVDELENVVKSVAKLIIDNDQILAFKYKWKSYRIRLNDIIYIVSNQRKLMIYTKEGEVYELYGKMDEVHEKIQCMSNVFLRVHKTYLINMNYIKVFQSDKIVMQDGKQIPVSHRKRTEVIKCYTEFGQI